jgi:hypothetical protein
MSGHSILDASGLGIKAEKEQSQGFLLLVIWKRRTIVNVSLFPFLDA